MAMTSSQINSRIGEIDFGRSYLLFSTDHVVHTPRLAIDAACILSMPGQSPRTFYLTCPCIAETMYVRKNLIHDPPAEFRLIAEPQGEFIQIKRHANAAKDVRSPHRFGERMPSHDGHGATVNRLDVAVSYWNHLDPIDSAEAFREALLEGCAINAITTYQEPNGVTVTMIYPCRTINAHDIQSCWQVDAGPVLMTHGRALPDDALVVEQLELAYVVYNQRDYMEAVLRQPVDIGPNAVTNHYAQHRQFACNHRLLASPKPCTF